MAYENLDTKTPRAMDEQAKFVTCFVDHSRERRDDLEHIWDEVEENFLVRPYRDSNMRHSTMYPYSAGPRPTGGVSGIASGRAVLKDPETHQEIMTIVSMIVSALLPDDTGFVKCTGRGFEDILRGSTVNALEEYFTKLPGHYWEFFCWILSAGIWGTGVAEVFWDYREEPRILRSVGFDPEMGVEVSEETIASVAVWDDPRMETLSIRDFFPDTGERVMHRMKGAARRFRITATEARNLAERGIYRKGSVEEAIRRRTGSDAGEMEDRTYLDESRINTLRESDPQFMEMTGLRYCGETPFKSEGDDFTRREIVVLNGETVRSKPWPRRLPWFDVKITPRPESFWGIGPGELIRHDQDFADVLKMMLADAVVRQAHPPQIFDVNAGVEVAKLRAYRPDVPIGVEGDPNRAVATVQYNAQLQHAFALQAGTKQQMREATSAVEANQGLPVGTKRLSASEFVGTTSAAQVRPEMFTRVVEREFMPQMGRYVLDLFQEMIYDTDDLRRRIGSSNASAVLADILDDYDIEYVGSRLEGTRQDDLAAFREINASAATNPVAQAAVPWIILYQKYFRRLGQHEIAAMVGNPQMMQLHMMLHQILGPNQGQGNGNGEAPRQQPLGALPAQMFGSVQT